MLTKLLICGLTLSLTLNAAPSITKKPIREQHTITIDTDKVVGEIYNLWDVRVINVPELWGEPGFAEMMQATSKHANYIVNVRSLGGTHSGACEWFKGVDEDGEPITDFAPFIEYMKAQKRVGFTPWIILDNVPWGMAKSQERHFYGQCHPPEDFDLWFKYVRDFVQALVDEFGLEEVSTWRFRVGTEPDLYPKHWAGTKEEYFKHYDYTVAAVESVIAEPRIGPGNTLMWSGAQKSKKGRWGFEILRHCAEGTNYYTGETGTRIEFFAHSVYAWNPKPFNFEKGMKKSRQELAKYPQLEHVLLEVHEYGELMECLSKGDALSNTEFFVGLYAHTVDIAYQYDVRRVYNWDHHLGMVYTWEQITPGLFQPWTKVMDCLEEIKDGERVQVKKGAQKEIKYGAISAWKDGALYVLAYSHHDNANQPFENDITLTLAGERIAASQTWSIDEKLLDQNNGVYIHQLYKDIEAEGIERTDTGFNFDIQRNLERRYGQIKDVDTDVFFHGTKESAAPEDKNRIAASAIAKKNLKKYQKMGEMAQVRSGEIVKISGQKLQLKLNFQGSGVRFLKFLPTPATTQ